MTPIGVRYVIRKDIVVHGADVGRIQGRRFARAMARTAEKAGLVVDMGSIAVAIRDMDEDGDPFKPLAFEVLVHGEAYRR